MEEITTSLKELLNRKYHKMGNNTKTPYYRTDIVVEDPLEVFYTVSNLLKVCVLAAEGTDGYSSKVISQPYVNIRNVLEFAIQLLPYEEMECLEQIIKSNGGHCQKIGFSKNCFYSCSAGKRGLFLPRADRIGGKNPPIFFTALPLPDF